ncbi:MAG: prolyl oligopeptidase family serine peptidase [Burkholderiaceae bacterium]
MNQETILRAAPTRRLAVPALLAAAVALLSIANAATFAGVDVPPPLPPQPVVDVHWGVSVEDPYRFLEDTSNPQVQAWMRQQSDATAAILARLPGRDRLRARLAEIDADIPAVIGRLHRDAQGRLTYLKRAAGENQLKLYRRDSIDAPERLLVDPEAIARTTGKAHAIGSFEPSPDGALIAYSLSASGTEIGTLHVIDAATGKEVMPPIDRIRGGGADWLPDSTGFFYGRLAEDWQTRPRAERFMDHRTYVRRLADPAADRVVFGPGVHPGVPLDRSDGASLAPVRGQDIVFAVVQHGVQREQSLYRASLKDVLAGNPRWAKLYDAGARVHSVGFTERWLYLQSAADAPRFRLLRLPIDGELASAQTVVAQSDRVLTGFRVARDGVYITRRDGVVDGLERLSHATSPQLAVVKLPVEGTVRLAHAEEDQDGVIVALGGWTRIARHYAVDAVAVRPLGLVPPGRFDAPEGIEAREVKVASHDGVEVPASILMARGTRLDGRNPLILYGYGAYGMVEQPSFSPTMLAWLERGGVFVIAHVRGGGVYGDAWHRAGWKTTKPNTWKDGIAIAEWLVRNGYTSRERMSVAGGSAGGIFVGRAITERPDLFGAAVVSVGNVDQIRSETRANGAGNIPEYGTVRKEDEFRALLAMSPYANVRPGTPYPAVLLEHGVNDSRVDVWMSLKFASRLSAATTSGNPVLLRLDYDSGHGVGRTREQGQAQTADRWSFLLWRAGHPDFQPATAQ